MTQRQSTFFNVLLFLLFPLLLFALGDITPIYFNNDDFFLKQIASGEMTGTPEAHLLHIGYLSGILLNVLYRFFPSLPWYGILLFSYSFLSISFAFYVLSACFHKLWQKCLFCLATSALSIAFLWTHVVQIQYTTITTIVCSASLVYFYCSADQETPFLFLKKNLPGLLLFFLALELRDKACIMLLPTFFLIGFMRWRKHPKMCKSLCAYGLSLLSILLLVLSINHFAYRSEEWQAFRQYNTAREQVVDYNGYPDYETYRSQYEALGISYTSYLSARDHYQLLLDERIDTAFMQEMADISHRFDLNIKSMVLNFFERHLTSYEDRPLNLLAYILYFFTLLFILCFKKWSTLADLLAIFAGRMIVWGYLLFIGRPLPRVTQGIYIMEILMLLGIICKQQLWQFKGSSRQTLPRFLWGFFAGCLLFISFKWGIPHLNNVIQYSKSKVKYAENYQEIRTYFYQNRENLYLLDTNSFSYFTEAIFQETTPSRNNFVLMGSWTANSPWTDSIASQYNISSYEEAAITQDNVFFVFLNTPGIDYEYLETYLDSKHPGTTLEIYDTFTSTQGLDFYILQAKSAENK